MGGTFDPLHLGHLCTAKEAANRFCLDKVLFVPAWLPPHKKAGEIAPADHRLRMVELGARFDPRFEANSVEVDRKGTSFTVDTLRQLGKDSYPGENFFLSWEWTPSLKSPHGKSRSRSLV